MLKRTTNSNKSSTSTVLGSSDLVREICGSYKGHLRHLPTKLMYDACIEVREEIIDNFVLAGYVDTDGRIAKMLGDNEPGLWFPPKPFHFTNGYNVPTTPLYLTSDASPPWSSSSNDWKFTLIAANTKLMSNLDLYLFRDMATGIKKLLQLPVRVFDTITVFLDLDKLHTLSPQQRSVQSIQQVESMLGFQLRAKHVKLAASYTMVTPLIVQFFAQSPIRQMHLDAAPSSYGPNIVVIMQTQVISATPKPIHIQRITFNYETPFEHILQVLLICIGAHQRLPSDVFVRNRPERLFRGETNIWSEDDRLISNIRSSLRPTTPLPEYKCIRDQYHTHIHFKNADITRLVWNRDYGRMLNEVFNL